MAKESRAKSALGGKKSESKSKSKSKSKASGGKKKPVHRMHISKTDNGKFLVDHEFKGGPGEPVQPNESHAIEPQDLAAHVADHFGVGDGGPGASAAPDAGAPAGVPAAPAAGPVGPGAGGPVGV
jgi:hypothetical protein